MLAGRLGVLRQGHQLPARDRSPQGLFPDRRSRRARTRSARRSPARLLTLDRALEPTLPALLALLDVPVDDPQWQAPRPAAAPAADAGRGQAPAPAREPGAAAPAWCSRTSTGSTPRPRRCWTASSRACPPARLLLARQLPARVPAPLGQQDLLHPAPARSAAAGERGRAARRASLGDRPDARAAQAASSSSGPRATRFFLEESVRTLVETKALVGERGAYRLAQAARRRSRCRPRSRPSWPRASTACRRGQAAPPVGRGHRQGRAVRAPARPSPRQREESCVAGSPTSRPPSSSTRRRLFPDLEYTFKHALTHEVAYGGLLQERRRALHARIVDAIETLHRDRLGEQIERLAHHALRGEVWEKAVAYLRQAGDKAAARSATQDARGPARAGARRPRRAAGEPVHAGAGIDIRLELRPVLTDLGEVRRVAGAAARGGDPRRWIDRRPPARSGLRAR